MVEKWNTQEFQKKITDRQRAAVGEFYTDWCPSCKTMSMVLDRTAKSFSEVYFGKVNVEEEKHLLSAYHICSVPTLMVFRQGKSVAESVGVMGQGRMEEWIRSTL